MCCCSAAAIPYGEARTVHDMHRMAGICIPDNTFVGFCAPDPVDMGAYPSTTWYYVPPFLQQSIPTRQRLEHASTTSHHFHSSLTCFVCSLCLGLGPQATVDNNTKTNRLNKRRLKKGQ